MKLTFEGTSDELDDLTESLFPSHVDDELFDDVDDEAGLISTSDVKKKIGPAQKMLIFAKWRKSGRSLSEFRRATNSLLAYAIETVAAKHGVSVSAIGDGKLLEQFLAFINEHWDEILALLLKLIGL